MEMIQLYGLKTLVMSTERPAEPRASMESTVLIVDDDPAAVEFLKTVISHSSRVPRYRVSTANSGFRAEQACRTQQPAVVLLDLLLPDTDGIELLRRLKAIDPTPEIIVISGQGTIKRALEAGQAGAFSSSRNRISIRRASRDPRPGARAPDERRQHVQLQEQVHEPVLVLEHHRQEQEDARAVRARRGRGGERRQHPDSGRERHRQGAHRQRAPSAQPAREGPVHQDQLRGAAQGPHRVRALRLQEGRVHRRPTTRSGCSSWPRAAR